MQTKDALVTRQIERPLALKARNYSLLAGLVAGALALFGCSGGTGRSVAAASLVSGATQSTSDPGPAPTQVSPTQPQPAGTPVSTVTSVAISPSPVSALPGGHLQFTALVQGSAADKSVTWTAALGGISASGFYTAPMSPSTDTVTAISNADQTESGSANVMVTSPSPTPSGPLPAFPGAQGGGAVSVGGRGGQVIEVTNLNDSGAGSLRACVESSGPRYCIFRVAGLIILQSNLDVRNPFLTIAGQTAPGGGITVALANSMQGDGAEAFNLYANDVVIRYIRVRPGAGGDTTAIRGRSAIGSSGSAYNIMIDHVSTSWSEYGNLGCWAFAGNIPQHNWTVQYSISAEGLSIPPLYHSKGWNCGTDQPGFANQMTDIDIHHTLFQSNVSRNPLQQIFSTREVNNIVFNTNYGATQFEGGVNADLIGNVYKKGPEDLVPHHEMQWTPAYSSGQVQGNPSFYLQGNLGWNQTEPAGDDWGMLNQDCSGHYNCEVGLAPTSLRRSSPLPAEAFPIMADLAVNLAGAPQSTMLPKGLPPLVGASRRLNCDGSWTSNADAVDQRLSDEFNGLRQAVNWPNTNSPSNENQVGGYPNVDPGTPCQESLHDGIPDQWKIARGLSTFDNALANNAAPNGYTYLENYLNGTDPNLPVQ